MYTWQHYSALYDYWFEQTVKTINAKGPLNKALFAKQMEYRKKYLNLYLIT